MRREKPVLGTASLVMILVGSTLAVAATKAPSHAILLERCGGILLVLGLALLGGALPFHP